ncbi:MAG: S26 family signal peptidase [Methanoregula sp.]|nr:S26 family signal peptidase [Methanoregula sp.]
MADTNQPRDIRTLISDFRTSKHWAISLLRDILWMVAVVAGIALALYLVCGTWPAVVTIESGSMTPHMNVGDLVIVVAPDRFGALQTWDEGNASGYKKYDDYGDVIIYRPNGITDFWASIGVLPLSKQHPIIHRAMTWVDAGESQPLYLNIYRGNNTPTAYPPLVTSNQTLAGYRILYPANTTLPVNLTPGIHDVPIKTATERLILPSEYVTPGRGYTLSSGTTALHGGYISKGDNNPASDQGYLSVAGVGDIQPTQKDWVIGKAYFTIPLVGLLPLHIVEVIIVVIILMVIHELYLRRKKGKPEKPQQKSTKKRR